MWTGPTFQRYYQQIDRITREKLDKEDSEYLLKPESTEGGRRVSVLRRQEGAPVLLG